MQAIWNRVGLPRSAAGAWPTGFGLAAREVVPARPSG